MSYLVVVLVIAAGFVLLKFGSALRTKYATFTAFQIRYQAVTLLIALVLLVVSGFAGSWISVFGDLNAPVTEFGYLGATSSDRWVAFALTFAIVMALVTGVVVWFQAGRKIGPKTLLRAMPIAVLFSVFNALTEEVIFRAALVQGLGQVFQPWAIALLSALIFGTLHYFGMPGKIPGVLMAGFMGWLLTFAVVQSGGIFWAWFIHLIQDIIILTIVYGKERAEKVQSHS